MNSTDQLAKKNNYRGIAISVGIHVIILLLFLWVTVWKEPYPPHPEYGIELNLGNVQTGSGNEEAGAEVVNEEVVEETEVTEATEESQESEVVEETQAESEAIEPAEEAITQDDGIVEQEDKPAEKQNTQTEEQKETSKETTETKKEEVKEPPKPNPNALFPGKNNSQGETNTEKGDQGVKDGSVDAEAMMGPQGGGNGSKLEMAGWAWDSPPRPKDTSDQNGKIVFEIKVDNNGEVISVRVIERTVSSDVAQVYQDEVSRLTFYKTSGGTTLSSYTGRITFIIRSR